ncbi:uncharacterized protein J3D65DRAFT_112280 [Phyllosticta citribraziliensis]|uniref:Uncharacterized protein n=1 Tax=Phyllosticta citribraziliensis TaxID=989973 RepID=A0ABR1L812_9PEZI
MGPACFQMSPESSRSTSVGNVHRGSRMSRRYSPTFDYGYIQPSRCPLSRSKRIALEDSSPCTCAARAVNLNESRNGPAAQTGIMFVVKDLGWSRRRGSVGSHDRAQEEYVHSHPVAPHICAMRCHIRPCVWHVAQSGYLESPSRTRHRAKRDWGIKGSPRPRYPDDASFTQGSALGWAVLSRHPRRRGCKSVSQQVECPSICLAASLTRSESFHCIYPPARIHLNHNVGEHAPIHFLHSTTGSYRHAGSITSHLGTPLALHPSGLRRFGGVARMRSTAAARRDARCSVWGTTTPGWLLVLSPSVKVTESVYPGPETG